MQIPLRCKNPLQALIQIQENGKWCSPIDHCTDCRDLFQLVVGEKGVPQDRYQRLYVLSLREDKNKRCYQKILMGTHLLNVSRSANEANEFKSAIRHVNTRLLAHAM